jgi:hypothetical protein
LFGGFNVIIVGREDIFKLTVVNIIHETSDDNGGGVAVDFTSSKNLFIKNTMFPHHSGASFWTGGFKHKTEENIKWRSRNAKYCIKKCPLISPGRKTHDQIVYVSIHRRWHSTILNV